MTHESMIGVTKLENILITQLLLCVKHKFNHVLYFILRPVYIIFMILMLFCLLEMYN